MKFSILVATMPSRDHHLVKLVLALGFDPMCKHESSAFRRGTLETWTDDARGVELLAYSTPAFNGDDELSYGGKRNALMEAAKGEWIAYFDDDDEPHPQYVKRILEALEENCDVVGFKVACYGYANNCKSPEIMEPADVSIRYNGWANDQNGFRYVRFPHHLAPTKREHAKAIGYRGHFGEDHDYSVRMQQSGRLKHEVHIDEFMYVYRFNAKKKAGE